MAAAHASIERYLACVRESGLAASGARAIGRAYVLEGATLGGRVLYKPVAARWPLAPDAGGANEAFASLEEGFRRNAWSG